MSGSDRSEHAQIGLIATAFVAAIGVAIYWAMFFDMGFQSGQNERKANVEAQHYASDTANQIERECGAKAGQPARECIAKIVAAERESQRGESDLAAQWKAANWVMWAGILAGAQLIATAFGLYYIRETLRATLKAVEDTGQATEAMLDANLIAKEGNRPWVGIQRLSNAIIHDNGGSLPLVNLPIVVKNYGNSPAIGLHMMIYIIATEKELNETFVVERVADIAQYTAVGQSLYPNDETSLGCEETDLVEVLKYASKASSSETTQPGHYSSLSIIYKSVASNRVHHHTSFYPLPAILPKQPTPIRLIQTGRECHGTVEDHHYTNDDKHPRAD